MFLIICLIVIFHLNSIICRIYKLLLNHIFSKNKKNQNYNNFINTISFLLIVVFLTISKKYLNKYILRKYFQAKYILKLLVNKSAPIIY